MEGFLDFTLPIWQRVLLTRSVAIVPSILVAIVGTSTMTDLDNAINISQAVLLPFALIPLLKFVSSYDILGDFAIPWWSYVFACVMGFALFVMNFFTFFGFE